MNLIINYMNAIICLKIKCFHNVSRICRIQRDGEFLDRMNTRLENGTKIILSYCKDAPCFSCVKRELLTFKRRKGLLWNLLALLGRVIENLEGLLRLGGNVKSNLILFSTRYIQSEISIRICNKLFFILKKLFFVNLILVLLVGMN